MLNEVNLFIFDMFLNTLSAYTTIEYASVEGKHNFPLFTNTVKDWYLLNWNMVTLFDIVRLAQNESKRVLKRIIPNTK